MAGQDQEISLVRRGQQEWSYLMGLDQEAVVLHAKLFTNKVPAGATLDGADWFRHSTTAGQTEQVCILLLQQRSCAYNRGCQNLL